MRRSIPDSEWCYKSFINCNLASNSMHQECVSLYVWIRSTSHWSQYSLEAQVLSLLLPLSWPLSSCWQSTYQNKNIQQLRSTPLETALVSFIIYFKVLVLTSTHSQAFSSPQTSGLLFTSSTGMNFHKTNDRLYCKFDRNDCFLKRIVGNTRPW